MLDARIHKGVAGATQINSRGVQIHMHMLIVRGALLALALVLSISAVAAGDISRGAVFYETNFSTGQYWDTNNPSSFYWQEGRGAYHYLLVGGTNSYACKPVFVDDGSSFRLSFDVTPSRCDYNAAMRFGLFDRDMDINDGSCLFAELTRDKYGNLFRLKGITRAGNIVEVHSQRESYGGPTVTYELNRTYRIILEYDGIDNTVSMTVFETDTWDEVWRVDLPVGQPFAGLSRLGFSTVGLYGQTNREAEGTIDTVILRQVPDTTPVPTGTTPPATTATAPPATTASAPTPSSPLPLVPAILGIIAGAVLRR